MTAAAPYPSDTRAKGWRLEIDHERIRQSDTWALASPEIRPWLLMLWMVAWEQTPCGSLPDDDALICARIGMQPKAFMKAREILLRGWWRADDGRLYHNILSQRVQEMLTRRIKDRARANKVRGANHDGVTRDTQVTPQEVTRASEVSSTPEPVPEYKDPPIPPEGGKRRQSKSTTFKTWVANVRAADDKPIPPGDPIFDYCDQVGLPQEFLTLHWREFKQQYATSDKRYSDWRRVLRVSVRRNWFRLWAIRGDGDPVLTTAGEQARREFESEQHREAA